MAALTLCQRGLQRKNRLFSNRINVSGDFNAALYVNNHIPAPADNGPEYTECTLPGYAEIDLVGANWSAGSFAAGQWTSTYPNFTFTFTGGGQTIYGIMLFDQGGNLNAAGLLDAPFVVPAGGGTLTITNLTLNDKNC